MDAYTGEIRTFGFNFVPPGWALCNGQPMSISQNSVLYSVIGTAFGGDGTQTFNLPNLQGCAPMGFGDGPGLTPRDLGDNPGESAVALTQSETPQHTHAMNVTVAANNTDLVAAPIANARLSIDVKEGPGPIAPLLAYSNIATPNTTLAPTSVAAAGGSQPHDNTQPCLAVNFCICTSGYFPTRS